MGNRGLFPRLVRGSSVSLTIKVGLARRRLSSKRQRGGVTATSPHLLPTSAQFMASSPSSSAVYEHGPQRRPALVPSSVQSRSPPAFPSSTPPPPQAGRGHKE